MTNFKEVKIGNIFDLSINTNSSKFTKSFINSNKGNIPVFSASKIFETVGYGYVKDGIKGVKYFENCLTWNIDGSIGYVFYRRGKFSLSEKVIPLILYERFNQKISLDYIKKIVENKTRKEGFGFAKKAGKAKIKNILIKIPIDKNGNFDLEKQKEIAGKYEKIEEIKNKIKLIKEDFEEKTVKFEFEGDSKKVSINEIFELGRGKSIYTREYGNNNKGNYPVYSAGKEKLTSINTYDFEGEYLTWATNGFAGYLKRLNGKFSLNADRGVFIPKTDLIDINFINYSIAIDLRNLTKGRMGDKGKNEFTKLSPKKIEENIFINIPIKGDGEYDLEKQKEVANKYEKVEKIREKIVEELEYLGKVKVEV